MKKPIEEEPLEDEEQEQPKDDEESDDEEEEEQSLDSLAAVPVNVTGTVTDTTGINWPFAVLQFSLMIPSGQTPVDLSTGLVVTNPAPILASSAATFTIALLPNSDIVPATQWQLTLFPFNNMIQGQTLPAFNLGAGGINLTSRIAAELNPFQIGDPFIVPLSHNGAIGRSSFNGSMYFDVVAQSLFVRNPATGSYIDIGGITLPDPLVVNDLHVNNAIQAASVTVSGAAQSATLAVTGASTLAAITASGILAFQTSPTSATMNLTLASGVDLNTVQRSGEYVLSNPVNGPTGLSGPALLYLKVMVIGVNPPSNSFVMQQIWESLIDDHLVYSRKLIGTGWFPWASHPA